MHLKQKGFTLIELMVVIAVMAIMATIALPNMSQWLASRKVASQAEKVANLLRFARAEAVRLNAPVYICPVQVKSDGNVDSYCDANYAQQGIAAYAERDGESGYKRNSTDIALRAVPLNTSGSASISFVAKASYYDKPNEKHDTKVMAFLPNGNFGFNKTDMTTANMEWVAGRVLLVVKDSSHTDRSFSIVIDSSGRVDTNFCNESVNKERHICKEA